MRRILRRAAGYVAVGVVAVLIGVGARALADTLALPLNVRQEMSLQVENLPPRDCDAATAGVQPCVRVLGGIYRTVSPSCAAGDICTLRTDADGDLIVSGTISGGTIDTVTTVSTVTSVTNVVNVASVDLVDAVTSITNPVTTAARAPNITWTSCVRVATSTATASGTVASATNYRIKVQGVDTHCRCGAGAQTAVTTDPIFFTGFAEEWRSGASEDTCACINDAGTGAIFFCSMTP